MDTNIVREIDFLIEDFNELSSYTKALNVYKLYLNLQSLDDQCSSLGDSQCTLANALGLSFSIFEKADRYQVINPTLVKALRENDYETLDI